MKLSEDYLSVLDATTQGELLAELVRFSHQLGFENVSAMAAFDHAGEEPKFISVDNTPAGYVEAAEDLVAGRHDPVMQHCKHKSTPIAWDQSTYVAVGQGAKWEQQARHGYACGIAWAMHMPGGRHFALGVDRAGGLPVSPSDLTRRVAALQLGGGAHPGHCRRHRGQACAQCDSQAGVFEQAPRSGEGAEAWADSVIRC